MSVSASIQTLIVQTLKGNAAVKGLVGDRVYDHRPALSAFPAISIGPSDAVIEDADCVRMRTETVQVDCWTRNDGATRAARELADEAVAALHLVSGELSDGQEVTMRVLTVRALRDPDGVTGHGVVTLEIETEA